LATNFLKLGLASLSRADEHQQSILAIKALILVYYGGPCGNLM